MPATATITAPSVLIRAARGSDGDALEHLAALDSAAVPAGSLLVAEADGRVVAAIATSTGEAIADPFLPTADVIALLELRAAGATRPARAPPGRRAARAPARAARQDRVTEGTIAPPQAPSAGTPPEAPAGGAPSWKVWTALWIVYIVWGSTYLAIRVVVETVPPLLGAGARFGIAGAVLVAALALRRGSPPCGRPAPSCGGALLVGLLLPGANAVVSVAEQEVPSSIAALLIGSVPLWVILLRAGTGDRVSLRGAASVLVGFAGVALLVRPGEQSGDATVLGLLACVGAALMWASGSFASPRAALPRDPLASVGWQMLLGGIVITVGRARARRGRRRRRRGLLGPLAARARLPHRVRLLGRLHRVRVAAAERADLEGRDLRVREPGRGDRPRLARARRGRHSTTIVGATVIVASVALVVRTESPRRR